MPSKQAKNEKARQARRKDLPADLGALVDADELTVEDAERRAKLSDCYTKELGGLALVRGRYPG